MIELLADAIKWCLDLPGELVRAYKLAFMKPTSKNHPDYVDGTELAKQRKRIGTPSAEKWAESFYYDRAGFYVKKRTENGTNKINRDSK